MLLKEQMDRSNLKKVTLDDLKKHYEIKEASDDLVDLVHKADVECDMFHMAGASYQYRVEEGKPVFRDLNPVFDD
jgi:hypothetical protein